MDNIYTMHRLLAFVFGFLLTPAVMAQITLGRVDTFQDGSVTGWGGVAYEHRHGRALWRRRAIPTDHHRVPQPLGNL